MKTVFLVLAIFTTLLYAEVKQVTSELILQNESFTRDHELNYGVSNCYALVIAEHQIETDENLLFYYGTRFGFVTQDYTAENGFGISAEQYGVVLEANVGVDYLLYPEQTLTFESSHIQNELQQQLDTQLKIGYQYRF